MRVALVSTWAEHCGIATYTAQYSAALRALGHDVVILGEVGGVKAGFEIDVTVENIVHRDDHGSLQRLREWLATHDCAVLHIQHEWGLFKYTGALIGFLIEQRAQRRVVLTMHTVKGDVDTHRLAEVTNVTIAHSRRGLDQLGSAPPYVRYIQVFHGTPKANRIRKSLAREILGIDASTFLIATPGFITPGKNLEETGAAILKLIPRHQNMRWIVGGTWAPCNAQYAADFITWIDSRMGLRTRTKLLTTFQTEEETDTVLSAADLVVLNSRETCASVSGQVHAVAARGCAILAADAFIYDDVDYIGARFESGSVSGLQERIARLIEAPSELREMRRKATVFARETSWEKTAVRHVEIYSGEPPITLSDAEIEVLE